MFLSLFLSLLEDVVLPVKILEKLGNAIKHFPGLNIHVLGLIDNELLTRALTPVQIAQKLSLSYEFVRIYIEYKIRLNAFEKRDQRLNPQQNSHLNANVELYRCLSCVSTFTNRAEMMAHKALHDKALHDKALQDRQRDSNWQQYRNFQGQATQISNNNLNYLPLMQADRSNINTSNFHQQSLQNQSNQISTINLQNMPLMQTDHSSINTSTLALGPGVMSAQHLQSSLSPIPLSKPNNVPVTTASNDSLMGISQMQVFDSPQKLLAVTNEQNEIISNDIATAPNTDIIIEDPLTDSDPEILTVEIVNENLESPSDIILKKINDDVNALVGDSEVTVPHVTKLVEWMETATIEKARGFFLDLFHAKLNSLELLDHFSKSDGIIYLRDWLLWTRENKSSLVLPILNLIVLLPPIEKERLVAIKLGIIVKMCSKGLTQNDDQCNFLY
jgi:hypothetical protein